ncbi:Transmembrane domain-containing protein [Spironucleus salmonicida]|uniref:Transmembrane domain-containing protein n=1 Tax=Spironucleus salmonicida TaxID=348837 RepID=V6LXY3_9EUKA|nr:Transmembrane domain-containing protein [Spironucleus salmonicida]|eukprot:EST49113.1 Transmembrane domain-containing protein [Spironucleus salmonicida]
MTLLNALYFSSAVSPHFHWCYLASTAALGLKYAFSETVYEACVLAINVAMSILHIITGTQLGVFDPTHLENAHFALIFCSVNPYFAWFQIAVKALYLIQQLILHTLPFLRSTRLQKLRIGPNFQREQFEFAQKACKSSQNGVVTASPVSFTGQKSRHCRLNICNFSSLLVFGSEILTLPLLAQSLRLNSSISTGFAGIITLVFLTSLAQISVKNKDFPLLLFVFPVLKIAILQHQLTFFDEAQAGISGLCYLLAIRTIRQNAPQTHLWASAATALACQFTQIGVWGVLALLIVKEWKIGREKERKGRAPPLQSRAVQAAACE